MQSTLELVSMQERIFKKRNQFYKYEEKLIVFFFLSFFIVPIKLCPYINFRYLCGFDQFMQEHQED